MAQDRKSALSQGGQRVSSTIVSCAAVWLLACIQQAWYAAAKGDLRALCSQKSSMIQPAILQFLQMWSAARGRHDVHVHPVSDASNHNAQTGDLTKQDFAIVVKSERYVQ